MSNLLAVDIGNTDIKFALFVDQTLIQFWRLENWRSLLPEALFSALKQALTAAKQSYEVLVYSSVAPELDLTLQKVVLSFKTLSHEQIISISSALLPGNKSMIQIPVDFSSYTEGQMGADRLVNVCAASMLYPNDYLLVISAGTASTFDLVDAQKVYQGGAIAPGWGIYSALLSEKTSKLPFIDFKEKSFASIDLGFSTQTCLEAGMVLGYRGLMQSLIENCIKKIGNESLKIVTTGGFLPEISRVCGLEHLKQQYRPTLLLEGLAVIYTYSGNY
jgi:type III pantothenate kinase